MGIELINIDDRLIHGQVATTWVKAFAIESIIIVDDKVADDPIQKKIAGLAVPSITVNVFKVSQFIDILSKTQIKKRTMLLFSNPIDVLKVKKSGLEMGYVNISGMRFNPDRQRLHKNVSVTLDEKQAIKNLLDSGVKVYAQTTSRDDRVDMAKLV